ncbi:Phosphatidic acid phosphatase type 2/haloperoxidase [Penicillium hispanicum]|uniref:Phosphatidic acid phosphatase type 2/haloperoxidase n=1 Tax=Penicillium hispanicum TaxID=1080232 RepID=UPI0025425C5F|nr:Phosphatidic acid phosphatase type 2/haloperoxidase [Penicillium hispanicum]KAJ5584009.1 Phosphatidic acid phosphatase type 2/haloperoxidase [Penicillium hispanicum]
MAPRDVLARISKLLLLSYIIDWVFIVGVALIGYGFSKQTPNHHPFSLDDASISFPYTETETVSTATLVLAALFAPAVIILAGALLLVPGTAAAGGPKPSKSQILRRRVWEWNAGWMGLAVAVAGVWMSTEGLKTLIGKPRPDLLARCNPDLKHVAAHAVGGLGERLQGASTLVSWTICRDQSSRVRVDGFSSFPSGHSSFSFAGLGYLTLWLCAKFSIGFPHLPYFPVEGDTHTDDRSSVRRRGAAPPVLGMILAFVPTATACFIAASRWFNFRHHGFDILFGAAMGILFAWIGFRMYHLPIQRGAGWAWGPRARHRAFIRGIGFPSSLGTDSWTYERGAFAETNGNQMRMREQPPPTPPVADV